MTFHHERLDVYRIAIDFLVLANSVVDDLPRGRRHLSDQLQRAALSIPLNVAEGAGEFSKRDKKRFYRIALRSATECAAIFDICHRLEVAESSKLSEGRDLLLRIVSMLTRIARRIQERPGTGTGTGTGRR